MSYCPRYGREIGKDNLFCRKCGNNIQEDPKVLNELKKISRNQNRDFYAAAKCPRCGSTSLSGHKKGFDIGKAVMGASLFGPFGLILGNFGAKKVRVTCLNCGKKFKR